MHRTADEKKTLRMTKNPEEAKKTLRLSTQSRIQIYQEISKFPTILS